MAGIAQLDNGLKRIDFYDSKGERRFIRIGKASMRDAEKIQSKIEELNAARINGNSLSTELAAWLAERPASFYAKLVALGLVAPRGDAATVSKHLRLEEFVDDQIARRKAKPATKEIWRQGKLGLIRFFGPEKPLTEVTPGLADDYREFLLNMPTTNNPEKTLAPMTVRKQLQFAKMIFRAALRHKLIASNPFEDVGIKAKKAEGRQRFITTDETKLLLDACSNQDWRTIIALSRWGGLRCPSEVLSQKIADIDWEKNRITVTSPKTEHHDGGGSREIPLYPELHDELLRACEAAPDGAVYLVNESYRKAAISPSGWRNVNLRTTFEKIVKRAGLTPWPRLFHNLRSSRQTELEERFPTHVVCAWLGNSPDVVREHYLQMLDTYWGQATSDPLQRQSDVTSAYLNRHPLGVISGSLASHGVTEDVENPEKNDNPRVSRTSSADGEGFEPTVDFRPRRFSRPVP
jgi:integrase